MPNPLRGHQPVDGLHVLKDEWTQKQFLGPQSLALAENGALAVAVEATFAAAPERRQGFRLDRDVKKDIHTSEEERRLESAMMRRWGTAGMWPIPDAWIRLVACQVPLFDQQKKDRWGYIDVLGVAKNGLPVVVELKKAPDADPDGKTRATETPLRMVLEAAAYAIALRKNWNHFRTAWIARLQELELPDQVIDQVPSRLSKVPLVAAAPASFWIDWLRVTNKGLTVTVEAWESFHKLLSEFRRAQLPVSFVSISGHDQNVDGLAVQPLVGFPPIG